MAEFQIVIPSAKFVSADLQGIGKLPPVIYPVNQRIVFDYLYKLYGGAAEFTVIGYDGLDLIKRQLSTYEGDDCHIRYVALEDIKDLGYSIYKGIESANDSPIIINFGDTIVYDDISMFSGDIALYSEAYIDEKWTYFESERGVFTKIIDKEHVKDFSYKEGRFFVGVFRIEDVADFKETLLKFIGKQDLIDSFYLALMSYSERHHFSVRKTDNWFDIGHSSNYRKSKLAVKAREFNHISIDKNRGMLKKTSDDKGKLIGEIEWYLKLPSDVEYVCPRIFSYSTRYEAPYVVMEYYSYHTLHELFLYSSLSVEQWTEIFQRIRFVLEDFQRYTVSGPNIRESLEEIYIGKTLMRLDRMKKKELLRSFFGSPFYVNGKKYKPLDEIVEILKTEISSRLLSLDQFCIIHGDLCFSNIMIDDNYSFIKLIDPRGKFGSYDIYGDQRYELAKLFHSVDGKYDFIIKDKFMLSHIPGSNEINFSIQKPSINCFGIFKEVFLSHIKDDYDDILLIEALLFLTMIPLHGESERHQLAMLGTGIEILDRILPIEL